MGGGGFIDWIDLLEDGVLDDFVEMRLGNGGEGRGVCLRETFFISTHIPHIPHWTESDGIGSKAKSPAICGESVQEGISGDVVGLTGLAGDTRGA